MDRNNRGIRTFEKRKSIFNWLIKQNADMCFLQVTRGAATIYARPHVRT